MRTEVCAACPGQHLGARGCSGGATAALAGVAGTCRAGDGHSPGDTAEQRDPSNAVSERAGSHSGTAVPGGLLPSAAGPCAPGNHCSATGSSQHFLHHAAW